MSGTFPYLCRCGETLQIPKGGSGAHECPGYASRYGPVFERQADRDEYDADEALRRYESENRWWDERNRRKRQRPSWAALLSDPTQQLDSQGIVLSAVVAADGGGPMSALDQRAAEAVRALQDEHAPHGFQGFMRSPRQGCPVYLAAGALLRALAEETATGASR